MYPPFEIFKEISSFLLTMYSANKNRKHHFDNLNSSNG